MLVKRIEHKDVEKWFEMRIESLYESPSAFMANPEDEKAQGIDSFKKRVLEGGNDNLIFACFNDDEIVGSVGLYRETTVKAQHKGTIWGMYVKPQYRAQGIGKKLLTAALEFAKSNMKLKKVDLSVESSRVSAKKLYSSMGFKKWGHEEYAIKIEDKFFDEEYMSIYF